MSKRKVMIAKRAAVSSTAVPRIRFKGCEGEWLRYQIGDCFEERDERTADGELLSVTIGSGVIPARDNGKLDNSSADKSNYKKVCVGDLAYNSMRMWQGACGASVFAGIVSPAYTVMNPKAGHDSLFYQYLFKTDEILRIFQSRSQGMTSDTWNLKFPLLKAIALNVPLLKEQKYVAAFFSDLEQEIASALARGSKLRQLKQSMLVKMFPQRGKTVPEVRFSEFKGEWIYAPLKSYLCPSGLKNTELRYSREDVLSVSGDYGIVNQIKFKGRSFAGASVANYGVVSTGDVVYTKSPLNQTPYGIIKANSGDAGIVSTLYAVYKINADVSPLFVETYFALDHRLNSYLRPLVRKGAKNDMKVSAEGALKGLVVFPSYKEQQKIGAFFKNLDSLIAAAEKRVAKLRQVKTSLLERMFA